MTLSKDEASAALAEAQQAGTRMATFKIYRLLAPQFIIWGLGWLIANSLSSMGGVYLRWSWLVVNCIGGIASIIALVLYFRQARRNGETYPPMRSLILTFTAMVMFFVSFMIITAPLAPRQFHAFISLFWALAYMAAGAWIGVRLYAIGLVTALAVLFGFEFIDNMSHYGLWVGVVGGGSLLSGGLWLRKL
jgi:hypothetical protein